MFILYPLCKECIIIKQTFFTHSAHNNVSADDEPEEDADDAGTNLAEESSPGSEPRSPGHSVASGNTSQRDKDLGDACQAGRNDEDGSLTQGQGCMQRDDKTRKLTSQCKVSNFV